MFQGGECYSEWRCVDSKKVTVKKPKKPKVKVKKPKKLKVSVAEAASED